MRKAVLFFLSVSVLCLPMPSQSGEVKTYVHPSGCWIPTRIEFGGEIIFGDADKIKKAIKSVKQKYSSRSCEGILQIILNSTGGIVSESLEMGEVIRKEVIMTSINANGRCFSSCVFVFAAGVHRYNYGSIGIHRPYFNQLDPALTIEQIRVQRDALNLRIKKYLEKIDVSTALLDDSLSIEPEKIKILSALESEKYRLIGTDASYDELVTARAASFWNMTSSEYRSRENYSLAQCQHLAFSGVAWEYLDCRSAKFSGISLEMATRRRVRSYDICSALGSIDSKEAVMINCRRNVLVYGN